MKSALPTPELATAWDRFEREDLKRSGGRYLDLLRELERRAVAFHLDPSMVGLAVELSSFSPHLNEEERAALTLLTLATLVDLSRGSTRTPAEGHEGYEHLSALYRALSPQHAEPLLKISRRFLDQGGAPEVMSRDPERYTPLLYIDGHLYHQRLYTIEMRLAERVGARLLGARASLASWSAQRVTEARSDVRARPALTPQGLEITLSSEQEEALQRALTRRISLISGGPGTGKTSIVVALLRAFARLGVEGEDITLAAPTGKAAWRMGESIRGGLSELRESTEADLRLKARPPTPQTLHRLLGYHPVTGRFRHHANAPLSAKVIVVDESSMIDVFLMERLISATSPNAQLVLLGDAHQLPSVSAGAVFRDLLDVAPEASATLTHSYRMREDNPSGRSILSFATQIKRGEEVWGEPEGLSSSWVTERASASELCFEGVELLPSHPRSQDQMIALWAERFIDGDAHIQALRSRAWRLEGLRVASEQESALNVLFEHLGRARLLCLTQTLDAGVAQLNARLHARLSRRVGATYPFLVGEPIMMLHNDYDRALFNGDQGLVLWVELGEQRRAMAVFPELGGGYKAYELEALSGRIELCYAMTVHKSQGSEFDHVALLLPPHRLPLLSRELIYTAVTRSKRSVTLVGDGALLSLKSLNHTPRHSGLAERVKEAH